MVFALGLIVLGVIALRELYTLMGRVRPVDARRLPRRSAALIAAALYGEPRHVRDGAGGGVPGDVLPVAPAARGASTSPGRSRPRSSASSGSASPMVARRLPARAAARRTALAGRRADRRRSSATPAPTSAAASTGARRSPRGSRRTRRSRACVAGIVGGTLAFWLAGLYQDWLTGPDALLIGFLRGAGGARRRPVRVADQARPRGEGHGPLFGAHGGVLDRLDAVFFTVVVGYYAAVALGYG